MSHPNFQDADIIQMKALGTTEENVRRQVETLRKGTFYLKLNRPCTVGDGIRVISEEETPELIRLHEEAAKFGRFLKFVPASGAASRMLKELLVFGNTASDINRNVVARKAAEGDDNAETVLLFMNGIRQFAFFDDLKLAMAAAGLDTDALLDKGQFRKIIGYLLTPRGLDYANLPKGLLKFHNYPEGNRTAFEEQLVETADYVRDGDGICRLRLTVLPEHREKFKGLLEQVRPQYEQKYNVRFHVDFLLQKRSTDTIAVDLDNAPFRDKDGKLVFRPGGHGALIENLNDLKGDIIYIKNIDNVLPDRLKGPTSLWKRILAGCLIKIQREVFGYLERLAAGISEDGFMERVLAFAEDKLCLSPPQEWRQRSSREKSRFLLNRLNRPLRVCGMVKNEGEPGGGPFWVDGRDGTQSLQIVEGVQVAPESEEQQMILAQASHFNPVDIVCGVRNHQGDLFDLRSFVDNDTVLVSKKSKDGRDLKALELPGLWNGAMGGWTTVFVEIPAITFNPVKVINDLLRKEHQPIAGHEKEEQ